MPVVSVNQFAILLLSLSTIAAMQSTTRASIVTFDYTGRVVEVIFFNGATDDFGFAEGQPISGSFVYDESVSDDDASPIVG